MADHDFPMPKLSNYTAPDLIGAIQRQRKADNERQAENAGRFDAALIFEHLMQRVEAFQRNLKDDEEIGIQLANFGLAAQLHIRTISYKNPNLIEFSGVTLDDNSAVLVQHISQLNFMLIALKPVDEKPYRIGF
jgi:hypothetical protein